MNGETPDHREATLFATPDFVRLWAAGGLANALRWLEVLAAALFTLDATGSAFAVAAVSAARSLPLLLMGGLAGVLADALNRKQIVVGGMLLTAASSAGVVLLAAAGMLQPWHLFVSSVVSGLVYGTEMPARRRMVGESVAPSLAARAVAVDSLTNSVSRVIGPLLGGAAYQWLGLPGAFLGSVLISLFAAWVATRVRHRQTTRALAFGHVLPDLAEALKLVRATPALMALLGVTVAQNLFGFAYASIVAPLGREVFGVSAVMVGVLAAAEPGGATLGGLLLAVKGQPRGQPVWLMMAGAGLFCGLMALIPFAPWYWACCALLLGGGFGIALYSNVQTTIALAEAPPAMRSRVMGLITVAIGTWPAGQMLAGWMARQVGALWAVGLVGVCGVLWIAGVAVLYARRRRG